MTGWTTGCYVLHWWWASVHQNNCSLTLWHDSDRGGQHLHLFVVGFSHHYEIIEIYLYTHRYWCHVKIGLFFIKINIMTLDKDFIRFTTDRTAYMFIKCICMKERQLREPGWDFAFEKTRSVKCRLDRVCCCRHYNKTFRLWITRRRGTLWRT